MELTNVVRQSVRHENVECVVAHQFSLFPLEDPHFKKPFDQFFFIHLVNFFESDPGFNARNGRQLSVKHHIVNVLLELGELAIDGESGGDVRAYVVLFGANIAQNEVPVFEFFVVVCRLLSVQNQNCAGECLLM